ncbi:MAG: hypothetical protein M1817_000232 [Caeruleum heppii]|nr:MAG: hypothetical protein M1817_000232 [Caeruleum heppii]
MTDVLSTLEDMLNRRREERPEMPESMNRDTQRHSSKRPPIPGLSMIDPINMGSEQLTRGELQQQQQQPAEDDPNNIVDLEDYLARPDVQELSRQRKQKPIASTTASTAPLPPSIEPVALGAARDSTVVSRLYEDAKARGLTPVFSFSEPTPQRYAAELSLGGRALSSDGACGSKREAKEGLARLGLAYLATVPTIVRVADEAEENWVGKLQENDNDEFNSLEYYSTASSTSAGPIYTEFALGSLAACVCLITCPSPDGAQDTTQIFGGRSVPFPNKKAAKRNAAKEAYTWLVEQGVVDGDGEGLTKKEKGKAKGPLSDEAKLAELMDTSSGATYAQRVNDLYPILGLSSPPEYRPLPSSSSSTLSHQTNLYSLSAHFPKDAHVFPQPIGEVRNVFGKKAAREACAREVFGVLRRLLEERDRKVRGLLEDRERRIRGS